jgi:type II secretory pathway pseudopilin PulG
MKNKFPITNYPASPAGGQLPVTRRSGFTIVELLVSMGIFVSVLGMVVGIFIGSLRAERSLVGFMAINDNVSLALEQMAREIRTGEDFSVSGSALIFTNAQSDTIAYGLSVDGILERGVCFLEGNCADISSFGDFVALTGNKAVVDRLSFVVDEGTGGDPWPLRVTIRLGVKSASSDTYGGRTDIQTTVSARGN